MKREPGFYWVRETRPGAEQTPQVAEWSDYDGDWKLTSSEMGADEDQIEVLSERLVPPGETDELTSILRAFVIRVRTLLEGRIDLDAKGVGFRIQVQQLTPPKAAKAPDPPHPRTAR